MSDLKEYNDLKKRLDNVTEEIARQQGALDHVVRELQTEFNVANLKEAKALLKKTEENNNQDRENHKKQVEEFQKRWGNVLESLGGN